jgi:hypothetical protein
MRGRVRRYRTENLGMGPKENDEGLAIQIDGSQSSFQSRIKQESLLYQIQATANVVGDVGDDRKIGKGVWRRVKRYRTENIEMGQKENDDGGGSTSNPMRRCSILFPIADQTCVVAALNAT